MDVKIMPMMPIKPNITITRAVIPRLDEVLAAFVNVGITNGGGAVKVGSRVEVGNI
jgi:hypothetical protein